MCVVLLQAVQIAPEGPLQMHYMRAKDPDTAAQWVKNIQAACDKLAAHAHSVE